MRMYFKRQVTEENYLQLIVGRTLERSIPELQEQAAEEILDLASQLAPVDTGSLAASGEAFEDEEPVDESRSRWIVQFGNEDGYLGKKGGRPAGDPVDYAAHVEYGTQKMGAQPFLTPAAEAIYPIYVERVRAAIANVK